MSEATVFKSRLSKLEHDNLSLKLTVVTLLLVPVSYTHLRAHET